MVRRIPRRSALPASRRARAGPAACAPQARRQRSLLYFTNGQARCMFLEAAFLRRRAGRLRHGTRGTSGRSRRAARRRSAPARRR